MVNVALMRSDYVSGVEPDFIWMDNALYAAAFAGLCLIGSGASQSSIFRHVRIVSV